MAEHLACLCEQANHDGAMGHRTIEGHCDHPFGKEFPVSETRVVNTIYGQFVMCRQCADSIPVQYLR